MQDGSTNVTMSALIPSNPILIHSKDYDSSTHGLPTPFWSDADTKIISTTEFWVGVKNPVNTEPLNKGLAFEPEPT
jgi:hypothetical protein